MKVSGFTFLRNGYKWDDRWVHLRGVTHKDNFGQSADFFHPSPPSLGKAPVSSKFLR
jgi:hypothetical protein